MKINKTTIKLTQTSILCAVAIILSWIELSIPDLYFMLPGMKLGLSNIAVLYALEMQGVYPSLIITVFKALFAMLTRGLTASIMSIFGGILSIIAMWALIKVFKNKIGYVGLGITGAFFHNTGQIIAANFIIGYSVFAYYPVITLISILTGTLTGLAVGLILPRIKNIVKQNLGFIH